MFNRSLFYANAAPTKVTVNIPTPDAADHARLYGELLEKARAEVRAELHKDANNTLQVLRIEQQGNFENETTSVVWQFILNGDAYTIRETMDLDALSDCDTRIAGALLDKLAEAIHAARRRLRR